MLPKVANHVFLHTSRAVALVQNQSGALRNVLQSGPAGAGSSWSGTGAGPGGAKFNAGSKFYKGYTGAGRAFTQANSSSTQDGANRPDDEKEEIKLTLVTPRSTSSKVTRSLTRRHSFTLPSGLGEQDVGSNIAHPVQMLLRELHAQGAASAKDQQSEDIKLDEEPKVAEELKVAEESQVEDLVEAEEESNTFVRSPFYAAVEKALHNRDVVSIMKHVNWLVSPSSEPSLSYADPTLHEFNVAIRALTELEIGMRSEKFASLYSAILDRDFRPNYGTYYHLLKGLTDIHIYTQKYLASIADEERHYWLRSLALGAVEEEVHPNQKVKEMLLKDTSFVTAMRIFDDLCGAPRGHKLASLLPLPLYDALLLSCTFHGDVNAALRVYSELERSFAFRPRNNQAPAKLTAPTDYMYYCLLRTYLNAGDLVGAKEVFSDYRQRLSCHLPMQKGRLSSPIRIWNAMIECYFKAGQPAGALRLLETMMDHGRHDMRDSSVPPPASSTYTTIIKGFCDPSPAPNMPNPPKPDIKTALSWFDRLLGQSASPQNPYHFTESPSRPDQACWRTMIEALVQASFADKSYLTDLNRLYDAFMEVGQADGLDIMDIDLLKVVGANLPVIEQLAKAQEAGVQSNDIEELAKDSSDFVSRHLPTLLTLVPQGNKILQRLQKALSSLSTSQQSPGEAHWIPAVDQMVTQFDSSPSSSPSRVDKGTSLNIDAEASRQVDQWFPANPAVTAQDCYKAMLALISSRNPRYPHPATLSRLITGLGRSGDIAAVRDVYAIAQRVLASSFIAQNPTWQSQAWFQIEDGMISAYAHFGDMRAAFAHRDRITSSGGIPSPDAYGSMIECVKDTTDDTSNAMALFSECQMLGVKPNVYLYNTIISKLAKARKADFALELFQQMKEDTSLRPSSITYGAVIAACARVGDATAAERLFDEMSSKPNFKPRVPPYNTMMQLYTHTKPDRTKVLHYLDLMKRVGVQPSSHTYKLLLDAYGTIEPVDIDAMEKTFEEIKTTRQIRLQGSHWAAVINAYGCVLKDLDKAIEVFEYIPSHPSSARLALPDAVTYESLVNVLVTHKRMDLVEKYLEQLRGSGVHMTAYIANLLIKGYAAESSIERARMIFESLADPPSGVAAPGNHVPHDSTSSSPVVSSPGSASYREPSTWEAMFRAELGNGDRDRAVALLERLKERQFPEAVYNRIRGIMLDDSVAPWSQPSQSPSLEPASASP